MMQERQLSEDDDRLRTNEEEGDDEQELQETDDAEEDRRDTEEDRDDSEEERDDAEEDRDDDRAEDDDEEEDENDDSELAGHPDYPKCLEKAEKLETEVGNFDEPSHDEGKLKLIAAGMNVIARDLLKGDVAPDFEAAFHNELVAARAKQVGGTSDGFGAGPACEFFLRHHKEDEYVEQIENIEDDETDGRDDSEDRDDTREEGRDERAEEEGAPMVIEEGGRAEIVTAV